jgi:hypothetical protein
MIEHQIVQDAFSPTQGLAASDACASEKAKGKWHLAGLKKYVEWMSRGRKTNRVSYVLNEWDLPTPKAGAEWAADIFFNAAEELLRDPALKDAFKAAIENGSVLVVEKD